jgi:hypothetical protein
MKFLIRVFAVSGANIGTTLDQFRYTKILPTEFSPLMKKPIIVTTALIMTVAEFFSITGSPFVFAASSTLSVSPLIHVPVYLTFTPNTITLKPGPSCGIGKICGTNTANVIIVVRGTITFTGCEFLFKKSSAFAYTIGTCKLSSPIVVSSGVGHVTHRAWKTSFPSSTPKGTYNAEVLLTNSIYISMQGPYNFIV